MNSKQSPAGKKLYAMVLLGIIVSVMSFLISTLSLFISLHSGSILSTIYKTNPAPFGTTLAVSKSAAITVTPIASKFRNRHIIGGFSADIPDKIMNASDDGVKDIFYYGDPPTKNSTAGLMLQALNMKMVDGFISSDLHYYECQRLRAMKLSPAEVSWYCGQSVYPTFASESAFLATIAAHLKQLKDNDLIVGYWVLDDWVSWDPGGARQLLIKVHQLIQQYTPDRPAICGFGGNLTANQTFSWYDWIASNFSPQGCDEVGIYVYDISIPATLSPPSPEIYDWSMSSILPAIFASLRQRGWDIAKEPPLGIVQAFGGPIANTGAYRVAPSAKDIETQSVGFCQHGAIGLAFYGWNDSGFGPGAQTPMSSNEIDVGIRNGIATSNRYWNDR